MVSWVALMAWSVIMSPFVMPELLQMTLIGVVQEVLLTVLRELSSFSSFMPITDMGASAEGAKLMTPVVPLFI